MGVVNGFRVSGRQYARPRLPLHDQGQPEAPLGKGRYSEGVREKGVVPQSLAQEALLHTFNILRFCKRRQTVTPR